MEALVRPLTLLAIIGLLMSVGLKVTIDEILTAAKQYSLVARSMLANVVLAPVAIVGIALMLKLPTDIIIGMVLVASAPFAPMAPAFAGIAKGNLPVAAGHMVIYSVLAVIITPVLCKLLFLALPDAGNAQLDVAQLVKSLIVSVFIPLSAGLAIRRYEPKVAERMLQPVQKLAQAVLLVVLALVIYLQFGALKSLGLTVLLGLVLATEASMWIGYALGGPGKDTRRSLGMGTAVRNMGIAMIIATGSFADSPALISVIAYTLIMIVLGLLHADYWSRHEPEDSASMAGEAVGSADVGASLNDDKT